MITARELAKHFGEHAVLERVDLDVRAGERVALLGLNGAGKTTFIRCLLGLIPFGGNLEVAERDVRRSGLEARTRIGYVPQRIPHFDGTLAENVDFFSRLRGVTFESVTRQLDRLGLPLPTHGEKAMRTLSGGMLQKVLLALALAAEVPLLLLDEPTANLDPRARREFLRALRQVNHDTTILLASHRLSDVEAVADRLLVLHGGRIAFDGSMHDLWERVGASLTLWVEVPPAERAHAREHLTTRHRLPTVISNGAAIGVKVERDARADVVVALREAGIAVEDFWTEAPSLHDLLERALGLPTDPEAET